MLSAELHEPTTGKGTAKAQQRHWCAVTADPERAGGAWRIGAGARSDSAAAERGMLSEPGSAPGPGSCSDHHDAVISGDTSLF